MSSSYEVKFVDEDCSGLLPWIEHKVGSKICEALTIGKSSNRGRGLYASQYIQKGDRILMVPSSVQLTPANLPTNFSIDLGDAITNEAKIAIVIMLEKRQGEDSPWKHYMDCLPQNKDMHSTLFWSNEELEMIKTSIVYKETQTLKDEIMKQFFEISSHGLPGHWRSTEFMFFYGLAMSRSRKNAKGVHCLVPVFDFFNHDASSTNVIEMDRNGTHLEVRVGRDYADGDEILISYGNFPNAALLMRYGFCIPHNPDDYFVFSIKVDPEDILHAQKYDMLNKQLIYEGDKSVISWDCFRIQEVKMGSKHGDGIPLLLRAFFRVIVCESQEELDELKKVAVLDGRVGSLPLKNLTKEIKAHVNLLNELNGLTVDYKKHVLLQNIELGEMDIRRQCAKHLLQGELKILNSACDWLKWYVLMLVNPNH